jgi:hypothetical protein
VSAPSARAPSFEQLEPRLLLSADLAATEPAAPFELPLTSQAAFVTLTPAAQERQKSPCTILTLDLAASSQKSDGDSIVSLVPTTDPVLPHLRLVNPDTAELSGQTIYLVPHFTNVETN